MRTTKLTRFVVSTRNRVVYLLAASLTVFLIAIALSADPPADGRLKVLKMGLGSGRVSTSVPGIDCGGTCGTAEATFSSSAPVRVTASPEPGSSFAGWDEDADRDTTTTPDCPGTTNPCELTMDNHRSVRPKFNLGIAPIPIFNTTTGAPSTRDFSVPANFLAADDVIRPQDLDVYIRAHTEVNTPARFIAALPQEFKQNWILMSRSESLQTGTAEMPRILLPSADARFVFTVGMRRHSSYPGADPNAIEFMQFDDGQKNFRFHEIVLDPIPALDLDSDGIVIPARPERKASIDDDKCPKCHSTRNLLNLSPTSTSGVPPVGTDGDPRGSVQAKNKPNWDAYDSWGGMMPFNRDRIYQGSIEAAAFRKIFNPWSWTGNQPVRQIIEQLKLQPSGVVAADLITRRRGGTNDGHVNFAFDVSPPVLIEPSPSPPPASPTPINTNYSFDRAPGTGTATSVVRDGVYVLMHHTSDLTSTDVAAEGRGVQLFDFLAGFDGTLNQQRIADELINHAFATGSFRVDIRPLALALTKPDLDGAPCIRFSGGAISSTPSISAPILDFLRARNGGLTASQVVNDTRTREESLPRRKADIQKFNLFRADDIYRTGPDPAGGLLELYASATSAPTDTSLARIRQEVFRRPIDLGDGDSTVMNRIFVDREEYDFHTNRVAMYRYFLEPLGVSVDKWSMGVRGRSRTYTFADVFSTYRPVFEPELRLSLTRRPVPLLTDLDSCSQLIDAVNRTLAPLATANPVPKYTDVQRIFNKSCIECHGGLDYPPYQNYGSRLDLSENETPLTGQDRLDRSYGLVVPFVNSVPTDSFIYNRITDYGRLVHPYNPDPAVTNEGCPYGLMPCGGPPLSNVDIETIRRWIADTTSANTRGDPHIVTVNGVSYDFQSAGEFTLLRGQGLEVQARQTAVDTDGPLGPNDHTGLTTCVSVNSAAAIRIGGHRITYEPNISGQPDPEGMQLRVDGKLSTLGAQEIPLESGGRIIRTTAPGGVQIEAPGGTVVVLTPGLWDQYQLWYLDIDVSHARATEGVMGAVAPGNWLPALPDGSLLGPRPDDLDQRYLDLYDKFENAWRVNDRTSLFDYGPGTSTSTFAIDSWPVQNPKQCIVPRQTEGPAAKPPVKALPLEVAQQHCRPIVDDKARDNCVQDVMVTGEPGFAQTYLRAEQIKRNGVPDAPVLGSPERFKVDLVTPVAFTWNKTSDKDGDPLTYRHCVWEVKEQFNFSKCVAAPIQTTSWRGGNLRGGNLYAVLVALIGCLLLATLIFMGLRRRRGVLALVAIVIVAAVIIAFYFGRTKTSSETLAKSVSGLESGKAYYWRVIAEDGKGGTRESETRRFEIK